jgi:exosortase E/protease (VPEID-CTERM system)
MRSLSADRLIFARWLFLALVLIGELIGLTVRFDTAGLARTGGIVARWLSHAEYAPEIGLAFAAALLVIGAQRFRQIAELLLAESAAYRKWWICFAGQLLAFGGLYFVTARLFEAPQETTAVPALLFAVWLALIAATLGLWFAAVAPIGSWLKLIRREWPALVAGAGVGIAAWGAGRLTQKLWRPLSDGTFSIVFRLLRLMFPANELVADPDIQKIGVGQFVVIIAPDCSGYEGIGLITVFLAAFLCIFRNNLRFPQALLLWPVGIVAIWIANAVRITALIVLGSQWSPEVAVGGFHSQAGWLAFIALSLALVIAALRMPFFSRLESSAHASRDNPTPAYLVPFLVMIATSMITGALQAGGFDRLYAVKVVATGAALCWYARTYRRLDWSWSWWAMGAGVIVYAFWIALGFYPPGQQHSSNLPERLAEMGGASAAMWLFFRVVGSSVTVPLAEELAFRGYVMRRIGSAEFDQQPYERCSWLAVAVSSALFGFMHDRWLAGALAGLVYALAARRRGKLADAVIAHALTNALIAATVLFGRQWWLWS